MMDGRKAVRSDRNESACSHTLTTQIELVAGGSYGIEKTEGKKKEQKEGASTTKYIGSDQLNTKTINQIKKFVNLIS